MSVTSEKTTLDSRDILLLLCLLAAGFAGNFLSLGLFTGFNYLFGSIATLLIVRRFGIRWGLAAAIISSSWTIVLFGHPYAMVWLSAEAVFVGFLLRRGTTGNIILYDALYWPLLGAPLIWFFFQYIMQVPLLGTMAALLMYWVIGLTNALAASLLMSLFPRLRCQGTSKACRTVPIHTMIFNLMMATVVIPAVIIMVIHGRDIDQRGLHSLLDGLEDSSRIAAYETRLLLQQRTSNLNFQEFTRRRIETIKETLRSSRVKPHHTITLVDDSSRILTSTDETRLPMNIFTPCANGILTGTGTGNINRCMPQMSSPLPLWQHAQESTYSLSTVLAGEPPWTIVVEAPFANYQRKLFKEHINSLLMVLVLNLLTLGTSLAASRRLSTPLQHISRLTTNLPERLMKGKIFSWPTSVIAEVDQLINNFRIMTDALNQKFQEISHANDTLERRVAERAVALTEANDRLQEEIAGHRQTERQLDRLMGGLRLKNKELEGIVYIASHDLRSPLVNVQGFSRKLAKNCAEIDRLISDPDLNEHGKEQLHAIFRENVPKSLGYIIDSIEKMDHLLNGLLRLSRLGQAAICYETLDIRAVMTKIVASMAYQIETAGARVEIGPLDACIADAVMLNQVFSNLLDNAVKYRAPDRQPVIRISSEPCTEGVRYCFEDNGIGIQPEHQDSIWEIFYRINSNEAPGEGLGLTMSRRIIDRLGGSISLESTAGSGSRFFVVLPSAPAAV